MSTRVTVIGVGGMLGHKMFQRLRLAFPGTVATIRGRASAMPLKQVELLQGTDVIDGVDAMDFETLAACLTKIAPNFIVNCVGVIKHRSEASNAVLCISINSLLPHRLAALAATWGGRVIHFSTDCVFSGERGNYTERDRSDAQDLYGRSKFLGEIAGSNALTLRTSFIGRELVMHRSLLDWFLSQKGQTVRGFRRVIYSGVTTNYLADIVTEIIRNHSELSGLYQVASQPISKHDLLHLIREAYSIDVHIAPDDSERSDRSMSSEELRRVIGCTTPSWASLMDQLVSDPTPYESWLLQ